VVVRLPRLSLPRIGVLDRYVTTIYLRIFGLAFLSMFALFHIGTFIDLSDKLFKAQATGAMLATYHWFASPQFIYYVLPLAALVATLVTVGVLTRTSELVVMRACGISLYRVGLPLLAMAAVWSGALLLLEESVLARANKRAEVLRHEIRGGSPQTFDVLNRKWLVARDGDVYHYVYFDPRRLELNGFSVFDIDREWRLVGRTFASRVVYDSGWKAERGWDRSFGGDAVTYRAFEQRPLHIEAPDYFVTEQPDAERMTYTELRRYVQELDASGYNVVPYKVALQRKLSFPFVTLVMTLLAVPFAVTTGRRGAMYGIGAALVIALAYWMTNSVFGAIGSAGLLAPWIAAWAPNLMVLSGAGYLLLSART
jgi:LPS export ABC transporter permease LptG